MKILAIRIRNLASLEGTTEIDFTQEPLATAGIFAITGPTGAGKSTILDALCLALYGKAPRYKQADSSIEVRHISQSDVRGILRDGTAEGFAEVDFVGLDQQYYRATWSVRRARNRADGNLQAYDITLTNLSSHREIPGKKNELLQEIERLVGLSFEQFTRSVLLAQGEFTAFLKAGRDEKSSLLEKLTGTQVYSAISIRIFDRHKEEASQLRDLDMQRAGIPTLLPEELGQLEEQQQTLTTILQTLEQRITQLEVEIAWYQQLQALQLQFETACSHHKEATAAKTEAAPRTAKLQQVERVQGIRTSVENLHTAQQQLKEKEELLHQQKELVDRLIREQEQHKQVVQHTEILLVETIQAQEDAKPLLDHAKALDIQLTEKQQLIIQSDEELKGAKVKQQQLTETFETRQQEAEEVAKEIAKLIQWKSDHASRQVIAENESFVLARLKDATQARETVWQASQELQKILQSIEKKQIDKKNAVHKQAEIDEELKSRRHQFESTQNALAAIPQQVLEQEKAECEEAVQQLTQAVAGWQLVYSAEQELTHIEDRLAAWQKELNQLGEQLFPGENNLERARLQKDVALQLLNKAKLAIADNVDELRGQLIPGEPCPVCGSTNHPYTSNNPQLDYVLNELEVAFEEKDQEFLELLSAHTRLKESVRKLTEDIAAQKIDLSLKEQQFNELKSTWASFAIFTECMKVPGSERSTWLQWHLQQKNDRRQHLQKQLLSIREQQQLLDVQRNECDRLEKLYTEIFNNIKDIERELQSLQDQHRQQDRDQRKARDTQTAIQAELDKYFSSMDWLTEWNADPIAFAERVQQFAAKWRNNLQALEELVLQENTLTATRTGLQQQAAMLVEDIGLKQKNFDTLAFQYRELTAERKQLLGGSPVKEIEQALQTATNNARQTVEESYSRREELSNTLTRTTTEKEQNEKQLHIVQQQQQQLQLQITQWLQQYNEKQTGALTEAILADLLKITTAWIEAERFAIRELDDILTRAETVLNERQTALTLHQQQRQPQQSAEELQIHLNEAKTEKDTQQRQQTEIQVRLRDDAANKLRIGGLLRQIETQAQQVEHWAKLNEVIGSADGKKFRQVAQEFTLDVLLGFANLHLDVLSQRYVLQRVPNSLGLQVVDRDMGDEVRTVYSLSGGESFLVSLALALGLASLSSNRMPVESLFIDEGFGSLDPNTLNIAMDALERLHNQGRKVGVISHVQEMTERIPVQIKVSKQQSGRSRLEVVGI